MYQYFAMGKVKKYRVSLKVDPMVKRYIDSNFPQWKGAYDLTGSVMYNFVTAMLSHSTMKVPSRVSVKYQYYLPITLLVSEYDFYHFGFECSELQQVKFSNSVRSMILDDLCRKAALAKVLYDMPITRFIFHYLMDLGFEDGEVNEESIRSIYNRKYKEYEKRIQEFYSDLVTDYGTLDTQFEKKIFGQFATTPI